MLIDMRLAFSMHVHANLNLNELQANGILDLIKPN